MGGVTCPSNPKEAERERERDRGSSSTTLALAKERDWYISLPMLLLSPLLGSVFLSRSRELCALSALASRPHEAPAWQQAHPHLSQKV